MYDRNPGVVYFHLASEEYRKKQREYGRKYYYKNWVPWVKRSPTQREQRRLAKEQRRADKLKLIEQVVELFAKHKNKTAVGRILGLHRETVGKYLDPAFAKKRAENNRRSYQRKKEKRNDDR